ATTREQTSPLSLHDALPISKECLANRCVGGGYPRGLKQTNGESAENCLDDDRTKGSNAEPFHPAAFLNKPCPYGDGDRQNHRRASYRAMTPLVSDSAMQRGNAKRPK